VSITELSPASIAGRMQAAVRRAPHTLSARRVATALVDVLVIAVVAALALAGRQLVPAAEPDSTLVDRAITYTPWIGVAWLALLVLCGTYQERSLSVGVDEYQRVLLASGLTAGGLAVYLYLAEVQLSRSYYLLLFALGVPVLLIGRRIMRVVEHRIRIAGHGRRRVLLVGSGRHVTDTLAVLRRESWLGLHAVGALTVPGGESLDIPGHEVPVLGTTDDLVQALADTEVDVVVFAEGSFPSGAEMRRTAWLLESLSIQMIVVPALSGVSGTRVAVRPVAGLPLIYVERPQTEGALRFAKRLFDVVGSLGALVLFSIPMLLAVLAIKLDDGGPLLFRQRRVGHNGTHFNCLKLRTMWVDAEDRLEDVRELNEGMTQLYKSRRDPRITRVGAILRRYSLDEVPQLINVLRGDMSLVGPRPALPSEVEAYESDVNRRLRVKPGLTGLWQVSGRSDLSWEDTVRLDLYYVDNWSMLADLQILLRTIRAVFGGNGAY
jgi:exopolysaccharide biosynthesis polyprenyl glycosylphosphotransferase